MPATCRKVISKLLRATEDLATVKYEGDVSITANSVRAILKKKTLNMLQRTQQES